MCSMQQPTYPPLSEDFKCPIGRNIMCDPVIAADGHVYDYVNISNWFEISGGTKSPMTNLDMDTNRVYRVIFLHSQIKEWLESIKNHTIPTDIMELVDYYYETQRLDAERILADMDIINNSNLLTDNQNVINNENLTFARNTTTIREMYAAAYGLVTDIATISQDDAIMNEIERIMINDEQLVQVDTNRHEMFGMFNASEQIS